MSRFAPLRALASRSWARWKAIAHVIGTFQARLLLSLFYYLVIPPFAIVLKILRDPLALRPGQGTSFWIDRADIDPSLESSRRQF